MGNYRQHLTFAGVLGTFYAYGAYTLSGLHWVYGSVAAMLATLGGLLPDLDHPLGVELKGFTGILAVLAAVAVWHHLAWEVPGLPFELNLWAILLVYIFVRHWMRGALARLMVHRGISHSFPCCAAWGAATFLSYPSPNHIVRLLMATAVVIGFLSHLVLDEVCSVELSGARVKRSFGSALKFWAPSLPATLAMYGVLSYLSYRVIQDWPEGFLRHILTEKVPAPVIPWPKPLPVAGKPWQAGFFGVHPAKPPPESPRSSKNSLRPSLAQPEGRGVRDASTSNASLGPEPGSRPTGSPERGRERLRRP